ncbi:MAG: hypothetical protein E7043_09670 [Lentisphaerae bacterium]|nr:hypothetical protein [Lentisphaerota bacterium]
MFSEWKYCGPLIHGPQAPGIFCVQPAGPVEIAPGRWLCLYSMVDGRGHDANCGVFAQLRADAPDGPVLKARVLVPGGDGTNYFPLEDGEEYFRCAGQAHLFGSQKTGVFAVTYYQHAQKWVDGVLQNPGSYFWRKQHGSMLMSRTLRLGMLQLEYDGQNDDWKIVEEPHLLTQAGWEDAGEAFCEFGPGFSLNHALESPVPLNDDGTEFLEYVTITAYDDPYAISGHGTIVPIRYKFDPATRRYRWVQTGRRWRDGNDTLGEASVVRMPDGSGDFLISVRQFLGGGDIILAKVSDPFGAGINRVCRYKGSSAPRTLGVRSDGLMRLFMNDSALSPYHHERNPLYEYQIFPDLSLGEPRIIADAVQLALPWPEPFLDMGQYLEYASGKEMLSFRAFDRVQVVGNEGTEPLSAEAAELYGVHYLKADF